MPSDIEQRRILRGVTLAQLENNTPSNIMNNSKNNRCIERFVGKVIKPNGLVVYIWKTGCSGREHLSSIQIKPSPSPMNVPTKIQCSCEYFVFTLEVANSTLGVSDNKYALPQWPVIRNPNGSKHLCKHLYKAKNDFISRAKTDASDVATTKKMSNSVYEDLIDIAFRKARLTKPKKY